MNKKKVLAGHKIAATLLASASIAVTLGGAQQANAMLIIYPQYPTTEDKDSSITTVDETSERSIKIYKYEVKDATEIGDRGDGSEDTTVNKKPLEGIKFSVQKVEQIGTTPLVNPLKNTNYKTVGDATIIKTDESGGAIQILGKGTAVDGIYLVTELPDDRVDENGNPVLPRVAKPADPFFIRVPQTHRGEQDELIYDVEVQPKSIVESLLEPTKTIGDGFDFSLQAGTKFDWEAQVNIPSGLFMIVNKETIITPVYDKTGNVVPDITVPAKGEIYADYLTISDTLNKNLLLDNVKLQIGISGVSDSWKDLNAGTDYTVMVDGVATTTSDSANEKQVIINLTKAGMKKVVTDPTFKDLSQLRAVYTTHTGNEFNGTVGNAFSVSYLTPGLKPIEKTNAADPEYFAGGFDILKVADDEKTTLEGAEFHLAVSAENAKNKIFLASDGKDYAVGAKLPDGVTFLKATSDKNGKATFNGLALNWYTDKNKDGKQAIDELTWAHKDIKRSYWVEETKAPEGYELLNKAIKVDVDLSTATNGDPELSVINETKTDLPFTGGEGTTLLVSIAIGAIAIGTVTMSIDKKRRNA